jgi:hypothetical protein
VYQPDLTRTPTCFPGATVPRLYVAGPAAIGGNDCGGSESDITQTSFDDYAETYNAYVALISNNK